VPVTGNIGHWNAVVGEVRRCLIPETPVDSHGKLILHSLRDVEPVQFVVNLDITVSVTTSMLFVKFILTCTPRRHLILYFNDTL